MGEWKYNPGLLAWIPALLAGSSDYVNPWHPHGKREYGIVLANAFGGIRR